MDSNLIEKYLMGIFLFELNIPKVGSYSRVRLGSVITGLLVVFNIIQHAGALDDQSVSVPRRIVVNLVYLSTHLTGLSHLEKQLFRKQDAKDIYHRIQEIGISLNCRLSLKKDWMLLLAVSSHTLFTICILWNAYLSQYFNTVLIQVIRISFEIMSMILTKYLIGKRICYIRSSDEYLDLIEETISHTRKLLKCNKELNEGFKNLATTFVIYNFMLFQSYSYTLLAIHVVGNEIPGANENKLVPSLIVVLNIFTISTSMVWSSSFIIEEVSNVSNY